MAKIRTRKRGKTYSYIFEAGRDENGKRKVVEKGGFVTKAEAYQAGVDAFASWRHGNIGITSDAVLFRTFMTHYMENVVSLNVRSSTYVKYTDLAKRFILPMLGDYKVQDITASVLDAFTRKNAQKGYSRNYLLSINRLVNQALEYAVFPAKLIGSNPMRYIKIPKSAPRKVVNRQLISTRQYEDFIAANGIGTPSYIPVALMYHTGMRIGEVLGLSWDNVDLENKVITVSQQIVHINNVGNMITDLKTDYSNRSIPIDSVLLGILNEWKKLQAHNELSLGDAYCVIDKRSDGTLITCSKALATGANRQYLVCTKRNGQQVSRTWIMACLKKHGINSHSFRHTHATSLIEDKAPLKGVARRLGHKSIFVTDEIYTHPTQKMQDEVASIFEKNLQTKK